ncbi:MAG: hypothetical protein MJ048_02090 [Acidaminococcaceae bacterium]|nr:hypothetical protein [Acidaminococcaceae bacterium]
MFKSKKILIALAVIGANVLHHMPVHTAFANDVYWYGKSGNAWTTNQGSAATSGLALTLTPSSTAESGSWADVNYFYGGYSAASATVSGNTLTINAGTYTSNNGASDFFAGFSDLGVVSGNILTLNSANFTTGIHLEAGNANGSGNVSGNIVNINNSTFGGNFEANGGQSSGLTSTTLNNAVNVTGSTFNSTATICGSRTASGNTTSGTVSVTDSTFNGNTEIYGNSSSRGNVSGGNIIIDNDVFHNQTAIYGGYQKFDEYSAGGNVSGGSVTVKEYTCFYGDTNIFGSYAGGGDGGTGGGNASSGEVTIDYAYFRDGSSVEISGGFGMDTASGNKVTINDIKFYNITNCHISAGMAGSEISGNELTINSGDFTGVKILNILGGNGDTPGMSNNTITINGGKFSSDKSKCFYIYAGDSGAVTGTGNILNINTCVDGIVEEIYYPQTINFKAPSGMDTELPMLKVRNAVALAGVNFDVDVSNIPLAADDYITLINKVDNTSYVPADGHYQVLNFGDYKELVYAGSTDPVDPKKDFTVTTCGGSKTQDPTAGVNTEHSGIVDGGALAGSSSGNAMVIRRGTYTNNVYAGSKAGGTDKFEVKDNTLTIYNGTFNTASGNEAIITGGYGEQDENKGSVVQKNTVKILDGTFTPTVYDSTLAICGGYGKNNVSVLENTLNVNGGVFTTNEERHLELYGGYVDEEGDTHTGDANGNTVVFVGDGSTVNVGGSERVIDIYGGYSKSGNANNNTVSVLSDTNDSCVINVEGGRSDKSGKTATGNIVNIGKEDGTTVFNNAIFNGIVGGRVEDTGGSEGNTLNLNSKIVSKGLVHGFNTINFNLPSGFTTSDIMLKFQNGKAAFNGTVINVNLPEDFAVIKGTYNLIKITEGSNTLSGNFIVGGTILNGLGTVTQSADNKSLQLNVLTAPIVAKDLSIDVVVNSGDALTLTGTGENNILSKTISGDGGVEIGNGSENALVKTTADKLAITGAVTVKTQATLKITGGALAQNITNSGTVDMAAGSSFGDGKKITGGAVTLGEGVKFTGNNFDNVTSLTLTEAVYSLSATVVDGGINISQLFSCATNVSGTIALGDITLDGSNFDTWLEDNYKQIQFADISGTNTLVISGSQQVVLDEYAYTFSQAYNTAGDSGSGIKYGYIDVIKEIADQRTLQELLAQENGDIKYTLKEDETVAGTLQLRNIAGSAPRTLTLKGNGKKIIAANDSSILKNNNADTLSLENVSVENFNIAISNSVDGTINLKKVTFVGTKSIDVQNNGTLNILDSQVNFAKGVTGAGVMNVKDNLTVGTGVTIEQNTINVDTGKTLTNNGTITINNGSLNGDGSTSLTNAGTVIINNGNLNTKVAGGVLEFAGDASVEKAEYIAGNTNRIRSESKLKLANAADGQLNAVLEGDGEVVVDSAIDATGGEIKTKVTINESKSLKIDADKLGNVATNNGTLKLSGGTGDDGKVLNYAVGGTGQTVITGNGTVTANAPITSSGGITVESNNVLKADGINIGANITNDGTVKLAGISGDYVEKLNYSISGGTLEVVSGTFDFTDVSKISGVNSLKLTDGTVIMDAADLFDDNNFTTKTALGNKFSVTGATVNLNNFGGNTFTATEYQKAQTALGASTALVMQGELTLGTDEKLVVQGSNDGSGAVTLSNVKPKVTDPVAGTDVTIPAVPQNYVPVTASGSTSLLQADTITVDGGSNFIAKGLQIDDLYSGEKLNLVVTGTNTKLTLTGGDGETGVVKADSSKKVPVSLIVENNAKFNAGAAAVGNHNELEFKDITIDNAKMNVVGNNVTAPELTIKNNGWLVVDPAYMKVDTLNIVGGAIQVVTDGAVFAQGYVTNELRNLVERAGVSTIDSGDGFTVPYGTGVMALRNSSSSRSNIKINKTNGDPLAITADPSYNPTTAPMLKIDSGALLVLDGSMGQDSSVNAIIELENSVPGDVSISDNAKVFVAGANAKGVGVYKLLYGGAVDKAANYFGGHIYTDNPLYKITLLPPEEQIDNTFAFKLTQNEENTAFSAENLGITRGAYDVSNMVGDAITTHFATKDKSEKLWATFVHNKDKVDGLGINNTTAKYDAQFNGTVVGYDLVDDKDITLGLLLGYIDGNTSNGTGHNDSKYHSLGIYGRKNIGKFQLQADITYLHGKHETDMTVEDLFVNADAKTNTYSIGVQGELPYKVGKGTIAPFAGVRYIRINGKEYSNNLNMEFEAEKVNSFVVPIGVRYSTEVNNFYGWKVKPEIAVGYVSNLGTKRNQMNITHEEAHSSYEYDVVDKHAVFAKAGLSMSKKNFTVGVGYDYSKSSHSHNNKWNVNMNWSF